MSRASSIGPFTKSPDETEFERALADFEAAWRRGERPSIEDYLRGANQQRRALLLELVYTELEYRLKAGEPARVQEYLTRFPELGSHPPDVLGLVSTEEELKRRPSSDTPPIGEIQGRAAGCEMNGDRLLGRFEVLEHLGSGSFGAVYKAKDIELDRIVALKVLRCTDLSAQDEVDRFLREARSSAQLRHPNIISTFDAGQQEGMRYLVTEFVPGETLACRLARQRLPINESVQLLASVARGLAYAHEQGVIHRDIKPSNILIGQDGRPYIVDFGLAKRQSGDATLTLEGQLLGTPAYMAPEQARGDSTVDPRCDIYSLGVMAYELLAGELPFRGSSRMVILQVLEDEPRPLRRISDAIPRDLENICLKAMRKEPRARYQHAAEFADDLQRFLAGEPVLARPLGRAQRLWRWCRRRPLPAALAASLILVAVAGIAGIQWQLFRAEHHSEQAEQSFRLAHLAVNDLVRAGMNTELGDGAGLRFRTELLQKAINYYETFAQSQADDPSFRSEIASTHFRIGIIYNAMRRYSEAAVAIERAREKYVQLALDNPTEPMYRDFLAQADRYLSSIAHARDDFETAIPLAEQAIQNLRKLVAEYPTRSLFQRHLATALRTLAKSQIDLGSPHQAIENIEEAIALHEKLIQWEPADLSHLVDMGHTCNWLAIATSATGDFDRALDAAALSSASWESVVNAEPHIATNRSNLAEALTRHARLLVQAGAPARAGMLLDRAVMILDSLPVEMIGLNNSIAHQPFLAGQSLTGRSNHGDFDPAPYLDTTVNPTRKSLPTLTSIAQGYGGIGRLLSELGHFDEAAPVLRKSAHIWEKLVWGNPDDVTYARNRVRAYNDVANALSAAGRRSEAVEAYRVAASHYGELADRNPADLRNWRGQAACIHVIGRLLCEMGQPEGAVQRLEQAVRLREAIVQNPKSSEKDLSDLAGTYFRLGEALLDANQLDRTVLTFQRAAELQADLVQKKPDDFSRRDTLSNTHRAMITLYCRLGDFDRAAHWASANEDLEAGRADQLVKLAECLAACVTNLNGQVPAPDTSDASEPILERAARVLQSAIETGLVDAESVLAHPNFVLVRERLKSTP